MRAPLATPAPRGVVQLVILEWDKSARGGEGARARSAVPGAFALPANLPAVEPGELLLDSWEWSGANGFAVPVRRSCARSPLLDGLRAGSVTVSADPLGLRVRYEYDPMRDGAPRRQHKDPATGTSKPATAERTMRAGEWVRVVSNGRFADADTGGWYYRRVTVNVAWCAGEPKPALFLAREPSSEIRQLADLW